MNVKQYIENKVTGVLILSLRILEVLKDRLDYKSSSNT